MATGRKAHARFGNISPAAEATKCLVLALTRAGSGSLPRPISPTSLAGDCGLARAPRMTTLRSDAYGELLVRPLDITAQFVIRGAQARTEAARGSALIECAIPVGPPRA